MANPAALLYDIFTKWNQPSVIAEQARNDPNLSEHMRAVGYLREIEEIITEMKRQGKRVSSYEKQSLTWRHIIFLYDSSWGSAYRIPDHVMESLDTFVDRAGEWTMTPVSEEVAKLKLYLDRVIETLKGDDTLSPQVKDSAMATIVHLQTQIDDLAITSDIAFERSLQGLLGLLALITFQSKHKSRWKKILDTFVYPYAVAQVPSLVAGFQAVAALGS